jgi:hypothetical protein
MQAADDLVVVHAFRFSNLVGFGCELAAANAGLKEWGGACARRTWAGGTPALQSYQLILRARNEDWEWWFYSVHGHKASLIYSQAKTPARIDVE